MRTHRGYTAEQAWAIAMGPDGARSVVDLDGGGYAVPLERAKKIAPPSRTVPIRAQVPAGKVWLLPGPIGGWQIVKAKGSGKGSRPTIAASPGLRAIRVLKALESWGIDREQLSEVRSAFATGDHKRAMELARDLGYNRASKRGRNP